MEVPSGEESWKTNIRKAVVSMLRVPPYLGQQKGADMQSNAVHQRQSSSSGSKFTSYYRTENVFAGRCNVRLVIVEKIQIEEGFGWNIEKNEEK